MRAKLLAPALFTLLVMACSSREQPAEPATAPAAESGATAATTAPTSGNETMALQKVDLTPGAGVEIKSGQNALVHYTGWLYDAGRAREQGQEVRQFGRSQ